MKRIHQSLQFKEQSKQQLKNSMKNLKERLDRFPLGKELQTHTQQLRDCVNTRARLETKVQSLVFNILTLGISRWLK